MIVVLWLISSFNLQTVIFNYRTCNLEYFMRCSTAASWHTITLSSVKSNLEQGCSRCIWTPCCKRNACKASGKLSNPSLSVYMVHFSEEERLSREQADGGIGSEDMTFEMAPAHSNYTTHLINMKWPQHAVLRMAYNQCIAKITYAYCTSCIVTDRTWSWAFL